MKKVIFRTLLFLILCSLAVHGDSGKLRLVVLDLKPVALSEEKAKVTSDLLRTELVNIGHFLVLERNEMDVILSELGFQETGCTDASCALEIGKILTANKIVIGVLARLDDKIILNVRMVDVEKSTVDFAGKYIVERESKLIKGCSELALSLAEKAYGIKLTSEDTSFMKTTAAKGFIEKGDVCGVVVSANEDKAILNLGSNQGVKENQVYKVIEFAEGEYICRITGEKEVITEQREIGTVTITEVEPELSKGHLETERETIGVIAKDVMYKGIARNLGYKAGGSLSITGPYIRSAYFSYETPKLLFKASASLEDLFPYELDASSPYKFKYYFDQITLTVAYKPFDFIHMGCGFGFGTMWPCKHVLEMYYDYIEDLKKSYVTSLIDIGVSLPLFSPAELYIYLDAGVIFKIGEPYRKLYSDGSGWVEESDLPWKNTLMHIYGAIAVGF